VNTAPLIPVEEYLRRTGKPNCEYIHGAIHAKRLSTTLQSWVQSILIFLLVKQSKIALPELTVRIDSETYLIPDLAVVHSLQFPYPEGPAELCIEILSPEDRVGAMLAKCEKYHSWGVPVCWVIDPVRRVAWQYPSSGEPIRIDGSGKLEAGEVTIHLDDLFAGLNDATSVIPQ